MAAGLALYVASLLLELPGALLRLILASTLVAIALGLADTTAGTVAGVLVLAAALGPLLWSLLALAWPGSGLLWRWRAGGRAPSAREREAYETALGDLRAQDAGVRAPRSWFVLDEAEHSAAVRGQTVMVSRGLLAAPVELEAVLAHELAHVNTLDGRLTEALGRLTLWGDPVGPGMRFADYYALTDGRGDPLAFAGWRLARTVLRLVLYVMGGGVSLLLLRAAWASYWRGREYAADRYAADLGAGEDLARFLEAHALFFDLPVPFLWLSDRAHPPVELRLDRLAAAQELP